MVADDFKYFGRRGVVTDVTQVTDYYEGMFSGHLKNEVWIIYPNLEQIRLIFEEHRLPPS